LPVLVRQGQTTG
jgi:hypothetical protein